MMVATDEELVDAMRWMVTRHRMIIEPSGAAAIAVALKQGARLEGRRVAAVVSGGNVAWDRFLRLIAEPGDRSGGFA
jgi:threonine dehydratase